MGRMQEGLPNCTSHSGEVGNSIPKAKSSESSNANENFENYPGGGVDSSSRDREHNGYINLTRMNALTPSWDAVMQKV